MADTAFAPRSALEGVLSPCRMGPQRLGVLLEERRPFLIVQIMGDAAALSGALGLDVPSSARAVEQDGLLLAGTGPGQWLALAESGSAFATLSAFAAEPQEALTAVDLQGGRVVLRVSGPGTRAALAKGIPVDLHPRMFGPRAVASTQFGHYAVTLIQRDAIPTFDVLVARSYAVSFFEQLVAGAAEFGLEIV